MGIEGIQSNTTVATGVNINLLLEELLRFNNLNSRMALSTGTVSMLAMVNRMSTSSEIRESDSNYLSSTDKKFAEFAATQSMALEKINSASRNLVSLINKFSGVDIGAKEIKQLSQELDNINELGKNLKKNYDELTDQQRDDFNEIIETINKIDQESELAIQEIKDQIKFNTKNYLIGEIDKMQYQEMMVKQYASSLLNYQLSLESMMKMFEPNSLLYRSTFDQKRGLEASISNAQTMAGFLKGSIMTARSDLKQL